MTMFTKIIKFLILTLTIIISYFGFCGFTAEGGVGINSSGKATIEVEIFSDLTESEFNNELSARVQYVIEQSDADSVKIKSVSPIVGGYRVYMGTRRLDGIKGLGKIFYGDLSIYANDKQKINDIGYFSGSAYNIHSGSITLDEEIDIYDIGVAKNADGKEVAFDQFVDKCKRLGKGHTMFSFVLVDVGYIKSIKLNLSGNVEYYMCNDATLANKNSLILKPTETGAIINNGSERIKKDIGVISGYIIYKKALQPLEITLICIIVAVVLSIVVGVAVYFIRIGNRVIAQKKLGGESL